MRKRWLLWIGGSVLALAVLVLTLALILGRSNAPFDFLAGKQRVQLSEMTLKDEEAQGWEVSAYSFRGDYKSFVKVARRELLAKGFEEGEYGSDGDSGGCLFGLERDEESMHVAIHEHYRFDRDDNLTYARGFVSVYLWGKRPKGFFDNLRAWMGL